MVDAASLASTITMPITSVEEAQSRLDEDYIALLTTYTTSSVQDAYINIDLGNTTKLKIPKLALVTPIRLEIMEVHINMKINTTRQKEVKSVTDLGMSYTLRGAKLETKMTDTLVDKMSALTL